MSRVCVISRVVAGDQQQVGTQPDPSATAVRRPVGVSHPGHRCPQAFHRLQACWGQQLQFLVSSIQADAGSLTNDQMSASLAMLSLGEATACRRRVSCQLLLGP